MGQKSELRCVLCHVWTANEWVVQEYKKSINMQQKKQKQVGNHIRDVGCVDRNEHVEWLDEKDRSWWRMLQEEVLDKIAKTRMSLDEGLQRHLNMTRSQFDDKVMVEAEKRCATGREVFLSHLRRMTGHVAALGDANHGVTRQDWTQEMSAILGRVQKRLSSETWAKQMERFLQTEIEQWQSVESFHNDVVAQMRAFDEHMAAQLNVTDGIPRHIVEAQQNMADAFEVCRFFIQVCSVCGLRFQGLSWRAVLAPWIAAQKREGASPDIMPETWTLDGMKAMIEPLIGTMVLYRWKSFFQRANEEFFGFVILGFNTFQAQVNEDYWELELCGFFVRNIAGDASGHDVTSLLCE